MYRSTFRRGWKDTILLPQQKKSYGVTVNFSRFTDNFTKITNAKISSSNPICSIQKVSNEKQRNFSPSKFLLNTENAQSQTASQLVIIFFFFFCLSNPAVQSRSPSTWHQVEARMQKYLSATWDVNSLHEISRKFEDKREGEKLKIILVNVLVQQWELFSSSTNLNSIRDSKPWDEATVTRQI